MDLIFAADAKGFWEIRRSHDIGEAIDGSALLADEMQMLVFMFFMRVPHGVKPLPILIVNTMNEVFGHKDVERAINRGQRRRKGNSFEQSGRTHGRL